MIWLGYTTTHCLSTPNEIHLPEKGNIGIILGVLQQIGYMGVSENRCTLFGGSLSEDSALGRKMCADSDSGPKRSCNFFSSSAVLLLGPC